MSQSLPRPPLDGGSEEQKAISAILERDSALKARIAAIEARRERDTRRASVGSVLVIVLALAAAYLWFGDPPFLRRKPVPGPSPSSLHAGARFSLYLLGCRLEEFRLKHGRLPDRLDALGSVPAAVSYERIDRRNYVLRYTGVQPPIVYDSSMGNLSQLTGLAVESLGVSVSENRP